MFEDIIKKCKRCSGRGVIFISNIEVEICECFKHYIFLNKLLSVGIPIKYIINHVEEEVDTTKRVFIFFKEEQKAFDTLIYFIRRGKTVKVIDMTKNFDFNMSFSSADVIMIYNLGLEIYNRADKLIYTVIKQTFDNCKYLILSFAVSREKIKYLYSKELCEIFQI